MAIRASSTEVMSLTVPNNSFRRTRSKDPFGELLSAPPRRRAARREL